jgi:hypothetical protein
MQEAQVRAAVVDRVNARHDVGGDTRVVHELDLCQSQARIDVAVINGRLTGWEIKTAADTLHRLPRQEAVYSRIFDRVWLAADDRHIAPAMSLIPEWWGVLRITEARGKCRLVRVRDARLNRAVELPFLVRLLWRSEALAELDDLGLAEGLSRAPRRLLWEALAGASPRHISRTELQRRVRARVRDREGWRVDAPRT